MDRYYFSLAKTLKPLSYILLPSVLFACGGGGDSSSGDDDTPNSPPTVNAGADQSVIERDIVIIAAQANDSDGTVTNITWTQDSGPSVTLSGADTNELSFTAPLIDVEQQLSFTISVTDNDSASATDSVQITIAPNTPPLVDTGEDQEADEQSLVVVEASASDSDGSIATYAWSQTNGSSVTIENTASPVLRFTAPALTENETLSFQLTVTDNGQEEATDNVDITIVANTPPTITTADDQTVDEKLEVSLNASASDSDGDVSSLEWVQLSGTSVTLINANTSTASFVAPDLDALEIFQFQVTATDNDGDQTSDTINVSVTPNAAPAVDAGSDVEAIEQSEVTLSASASDSDGTIEIIDWTQTAGTTATLSNTSSISPSFTVPNISEEETLTFRLNVTDNDGDTSSDEVSIVVSPLNYNIVVFDKQQRCNQSDAEDITVTFYDTEGNEEVFPLEYTGPEQTYQLEPSGDQPLSLKIENSSIQYIGLNVSPTVPHKFGFTPSDNECACSNYTITLNEAASDAYLYISNSSRSGSLGASSVTWTNQQICVDDEDSVYIQDRVNHRTAKVTIEDSTSITVPSLSDVETTILDGDAPQEVFDESRGLFSIDAFTPRAESATLESISKYRDYNISTMTGRYPTSDDITDYRANFYYVLNDATITLNQTPTIMDTSITNPFIIEYHSALVPSATLSAGFEYDAFLFENLAVTIEEESVVLSGTEGTAFDAAVILSVSNGKGLNLIMPITDNTIDFSLLENAGIDSFQGPVYILPVDYVDTDNYEESVPLFFRQAKSGLDLRFRYLFLSLN